MLMMCVLTEGVVVLLGGCARHLPAESPKVGSALTALLEALNVPSHSVQKAVSEWYLQNIIASFINFYCGSLNCVFVFYSLGNLAPTLPAERHQPLIDQLMARIGGTVSDISFAERKGAALGLAGIVRGLKIAALKKHNIMQSLTSLVETKGQPGARQGAMLAYGESNFLFTFTSFSDSVFCCYYQRPCSTHLVPSLSRTSTCCCRTCFCALATLIRMFAPARKTRLRW
jgi:hypothetical protein